MQFTLPQLNYGFNDLNEFIDAVTMETHHGKHHAGYTKKLNAAIEGLEVGSIEELLNTISKHSAGIRNNGGGFYNHKLFWEIMTPGGSSLTEGGDLHKAIVDAFGSFDEFKAAFIAAATGQFGSGWAWLQVDQESHKLSITSTPNQDNPLMDVVEQRGTPILGLDVWEHAYYLKYKNLRGQYADNFFKVIDWKAVEGNYQNALGA